MIKKFIDKYVYKYLNDLVVGIDINRRIGSVDQAIFISQVKLYFDQKNEIDFKDFGFSLFSQFEEDGILLAIFSIIGFKSKTVVEICCGDGIECNAANLLLNHKFYGLLIDGNSGNIEKAKRFYSKQKSTYVYPPKLLEAWVTRDNVNELILNSGFSGEVDLLSLDIDGNDYWILKELNAVSPRVIILEFNHLLGPEVKKTIPYDPNFVCEFTSDGSDYSGASLNAFVELLKEKQYTLVAANTFCTNAVFIKNEEVRDGMVIRKNFNFYFNHPRVKYGMTCRYNKIKNKLWLDV